MKLVVSILLSIALSGCLEVDYYLHAATGHIELLRKRQAIPDLLVKTSTPEELHTKLEEVIAIRNFATRDLLLPENESYRSYVKLDRPYVVWNVIATPEFSLTPLEWCFPVVGCVSYRGYFDHQKATDFASSLDAENDTLVVGVPAYSTLSWFDDPVLSTFSDWPEVYIAKLIFHELAHQKLYIANDTAFNESFATAVEQVGIDLWLKESDDQQQATAYSQQRQRQRQIHQLLKQTSLKLKKLYQRDISVAAKRQQKLDIFSDLRNNYRQLKSGWNGFSGYDQWFAELNNARFAFINNYHGWVPAFKLILQQEEQNLEKFYWRCRVIANMPANQRHQLLDTLAKAFNKQSELDSDEY